MLILKQILCNYYNFYWIGGPKICLVRPNIVQVDNLGLGKLIV